MAVLMEFAMFPTDKGISVSEYVSKVVAMIRQSGYDYQLTPMGTIVETPTIEKALEIVHNAYQTLAPFSERVYATIKLDIKKGQEGMMKQKIASVEQKIGKVN